MSRWVLLILSTRCRARYWNESLVDGLGRFCAETFDEARFVDQDGFYEAMSEFALEA